MSVSVFPEETSVWTGELISKAGGLPHCGWASSNPFKTPNQDKKAEEWQIHSLLELTIHPLPLKHSGTTGSQASGHGLNYTTIFPGFELAARRLWASSLSCRNNHMSQLL